MSGNVFRKKAKRDQVSKIKFLYVIGQCQHSRKVIYRAGKYNLL